MNAIDLLIIVGKCAFMMLFLLQILPLLIWGERKGAAYIQDRPGPNRAEVAGLRVAGMVHTITDVLKLLFKEDVTPAGVYQPYYKLAPIISMSVALVTFAVIPFAAPLEIGGTSYPALVADLDAGLLYILAVSSLGIYGIMLAGWASNNKYALLGGIRSSAQMISYEISMGLAVAVVFMMAGSTRPSVIVDMQGAMPWHWTIASVPGFIAFVMFATAGFAETNRLPFDLPEGESELVAGYHTEYSAFKFAMFFMAEYVNMIVISGILVTLFFGGYQVPFLSTDFLRSNAPTVTSVAFLGGALGALVVAVLIFRLYKPGRFGDARDKEPLILGAACIAGALVSAGLALIPDYSNPLAATLATALIQFSVFTAKVLFFCWVFIWVRWTLPRFRYDQLMRLGWSYMLPLGFFNLVLAGGYLVLRNGL